MDFEYMGKILLSAVFFAPGLILLSGALIVGTLMLIEKWGVFEHLSTRKKIETKVTPIVSEGVVGELKQCLDSSRTGKIELGKQVNKVP